MVLLCTNPAAFCRRAQALPRTPALGVFVHKTYLTKADEAGLNGRVDPGEPEGSPGLNRRTFYIAQPGSAVDFIVSAAGWWCRS
jgi:hypothetical protein